MKPYLADTDVTLYHGDCRDVLRNLPDASIDAVVTDPPYELGFMGKRWDASGIAYSLDVWGEVLRVLKPGGHLLAFGGTRTYHRMTCAIEDSGFEIRDCLQWLYGSGFPKSLDVSKAIDKQRHDREDIYRVTGWIREARDAAGITNRDIDNAFGFSGMAGHWTSSKSQPAVPTLEQVPTLLDVLGISDEDVPAEVRRLLFDLNGRKGQPGEAWHRREVIGFSENGIAGGTGKHGGQDNAYGFGAAFDITAPATDAARQWDGWGTALKPANEPIVLARKPLSGTVAANVLAHGVGALNIDACRIDASEWPVTSAGGKQRTALGYHGGTAADGSFATEAHPAGRWPANVLLDEAAATILDTQSGDRPGFSGGGTHGAGFRSEYVGGADKGWTKESPNYFSDTGGASRFFYVAKPAAAERNNAHDVNNLHPTVKPVTLMRHLARLITPPGGTILDPFIGSGTTALAARAEGFRTIGIDQSDEYLKIAAGRLSQLSLLTEGHEA